MTTDMKDTPIIDRKAIDRLKRLKRRRDFLQSRVDDGDANGRELSFDKGELSALVWAVEVIETTQALIKRNLLTTKAKDGKWGKRLRKLPSTNPDKGDSNE